MKKTACLLLCLIFICATCLFSCNPQGKEESKTETSDTSGAKNGKYVADLPDNLDFGGRTITFLTTGIDPANESEIVFNDYSDGGEQKISSVINEAIQKRNAIVESTLNVVIKDQYIQDAGRMDNVFTEYIRNNVNAGTGDYQVVVPSIYDSALLAAGGYLVNLKTVPYMNLEQPWWDQTFNNEVTINDKLYFTLGDIGIDNKNATAAIMFNKKITEKYNMGNLYDLVKNKKWTIDKAFELAKMISNDENLDGKIDYNDSMGWSGQLDDMWHLFYGTGEKIASRGSDNYPVLTMYNERSATIIDKLSAFLQDDKHYISANDYFNEAPWPTELTIRPFLEGRCLFFSALVEWTDRLDDMVDDFGILPIPLCDENQSEYHSLINPWTGNCFTIPVTVSSEDDLKFVGAVLEAMGAESKNYVQYAYYEVTLKYQKTRDQESVDMLDIIFGTRGCDMGIVYRWGKLDMMLHDLAAQTPGTFTSTYDSLKDKAQSDLEATVNAFKDMK